MTGLDTFRLSLTSVADIAVALSIFPRLMVTGPTQTDTAYGATLPVIILALSPLLGCMVTRFISSRSWLIVVSLFRVLLAGVIFLSPEIPFISAGLLATFLALSWGMRLQEIVVIECSQTVSRLVDATILAAPVVALMALLKFYDATQNYLVSGSIALYLVALLLMVVKTVLQNATAGTTTINPRISNWSFATMPGLVAYEIVLSCLAGLIGVVPVILLLTDQSTIFPSLRTDLIFSLSGWLAGCLWTNCVQLKPNPGTAQIIDREQKPARQVGTERSGRLRLEHVHLMFTATLGALTFTKFSPIAYPLLFLTAAMAASIATKCSESRDPSDSKSRRRDDATCRRGALSERNRHICNESCRPGEINDKGTLLTNRPTWQTALTLTVLVIASAFAYVDLSPKLSALQPIHVDRTLAAICFMPSLIAAFLWPETRKITLRLVAHLVPVRNPLKQSFSFYVTKNVDLSHAIMIGWRLNATIVILTNDHPQFNQIVKAGLGLGNIYALKLTEWQLAKETFLNRISNGERFLLLDFTGANIEYISPMPPSAAIGLIEQTNDSNSIVISDMVPAESAALSGAALLKVSK